MAQIIGLPKLSPTMEEGVLVKWTKQEGDTIEPGDLIAEVETDKANMDFNIEDDGVILKLLVDEGATVKLGAPVAIIGESGEDIADLIAEAEAQASGKGGGDQQAADGVTPIDKASKKSEPVNPLRRIEKDSAKDSGKGGDKGGDKRPAAPAPASQGGRILASPLAKTLAVELDISLRGVEGSGPGGRIVERDVRAAAESGGARAQGPALASGVDQAAIDAQTPENPDDYSDEPLSNMRKRIAQRLTAAKQSIPHIYLTRSFEASALLAYRKRLNELMGDRGKISVNDLIIKAVAVALRRVPECNAAFIGDAIRAHKRIHVGVAVAIPDGLVTPVVRDADQKGIGAIGAEIRDLAGRARDRRLKVHEIQGSTFTVSNLGMFGIDHFEAIINPPEAGILAVGTVSDQPVVKAGKVVAGKVMRLTMSCDHRVIDGALGARYLSELVELLENPDALAL